ncbi:MAG TPA: hypothetical protein VFJ57_14045 [Solirubrobacterales bacterium]|nr:hypothetical protein [Solirubrobacterales bacterium]
MSIGARTSSLFAAGAIAISCLLAVIASAAQATFPGHPGLIVFSKVTLDPQSGEGTGGLFAIQPGQGTLRQLTNNPRDYSPSFDPTGRKIVFRRVATPPASTVGGIYMLDMKSGETRSLTSVGSDTDPAFGRGGEIVFSRFFRSSGSYDLVLRRSSGKLLRLTTDSANDGDAVFMPDGERIVFSSVERHLVALTGARRGALEERIYSIRTDGTGLRLISRLPGAEDLDVSPDGREISFSASLASSPAPNGFAVLTRLIGKRNSRVVAKDGSAPVYSPAGAEIAYTNHRGVWVHPLRDPARRVVATEYEPMTPGGELVVDPAWQPLP